MQTIDGDSFRGIRVRMSGDVQANDVIDWSGLWMRVDGQKNEMLSFDNMQDRPVKGSCDWQKYEIVLDVPSNAHQIAFGLLLTGKGQVWMDDLKFEVVGMDVATTSTGSGLNQLNAKSPKNLDFEE